MLDWFSERQFFTARRWSNQQIRALGLLFSGDGINVSGWDDRDKEGGCYRAYFPGLSTYVISNYLGHRGIQGAQDEILLDLSAPLPPDLTQRFDLVFNHTTLEHVFDMRQAFSNLCAMARDAVLVVVPWAQVAHPTESYGDYWRFSPEAIRRLFASEGFTPIYVSASPMADAAIYVIGLGVREPARWSPVDLPAPHIPDPLGRWIGGPSIGFRLLTRLHLARAFGSTPR